MNARKMLVILGVKNTQHFLLQDYFLKTFSWQKFLKKKDQFITHQSSTQLFKYWSRHLHQHLSEKHLDTMKSPLVKGY